MSEQHGPSRADLFLGYCMMVVSDFWGQDDYPGRAERDAEADHARLAVAYDERPRHRLGCGTNRVRGPRYGT